MKRISLFVLVALALGGFSACKAMGGGSTSASSGGAVEAGVIEFTFTPLEGMDSEEVYLVGDFNGWNPGDPNLLMEEDNGVFYLEYELDPGTYYFKFYIDGEWVSDAAEYNFTPATGEFAGDGFGGQNAVLTVE